MREVKGETYELDTIADDDDHTQVSFALNYCTGFFDGWIKTTKVLGAIKSIDLSWKLTGRSPVKRSCYIDLNTTENEPPSYEEADGAVVSDGVWHQFKLFNPADPMPLPLFKGSDTITFYVAYVEGTAEQTADVVIDFRAEQEIK